MKKVLNMILELPIGTSLIEQLLVVNNKKRTNNGIGDIEGP